MPALPAYITVKANRESGRGQKKQEKFGMEAETLCKELGLDYYIKDSLRAEMERE